MRVYRTIRFATCTAIGCGCLVWIAGCVLQPPTSRSPRPAPAIAAPANPLELARSAWKAGDTAAAWKAVKSVAITALPAGRQLAAAELKAHIALATRRPQVALRALSAAPQAAGRKARAGFLALKARALFAAGLPARGLEIMVKRGRLAAAPQAVRANNRLTWRLISGARPLPSALGLSRTAQGWIVLARIQHEAWEEPKRFMERITTWSANWPDHPANGRLLAQIRARERARWQYPEKIAVLLPLSGDYAGQAHAVEAGLLAGYYRGAKPRPQVVIYDTHGTVSGARAALSKADAAAAQFVVGPLAPAGVRGIVPRHPGVPVLALNYLPDESSEGATSRFYQFGLSPVQQARAAAERAVSQGLSRAVVLVPARSWGQRIARAFTQRLTELGGRVLAIARFQPGAVKFAAPLTSLMGINRSRMRKQRLSAVLDQPLTFSPRRRQDIEFVFFAASFTTARLLAPQIDYYHGIGLPVYSISNLYQVGKTPNELDGVHFPIMPWFVSDEAAIKALRGKLAGLFPQSWHRHARFYALGYDAWRMIPLLANSRDPLSRPVRGVTGTLKMGKNGVIVRRAAWAHYAEGRVIPARAGEPAQ